MTNQLETIKFINEHKDWRELLTLPPYCLSIKEENGFAILKYSQIDSDFNEQICRECRGLIVDLHNGVASAVALSFFKFFNVQETFADKIYWKKCRVQEKVDGSKMLVWYNKYDKKWMVSTSGNLDAYTTPVGFASLTFGDLFDRALATLNIEKDNFFSDAMLNQNFCYTFELVSPESRVVIPYKKTKIYFIGLRNTISFEEIDPDKAVDICEIIPRPKEYKLDNLKACLNATAAMGYDEEGFVVVDYKWSRVKIKSPAYVSAHYLKNNGVNSQARILEIIENNEQSEFLGLFPEYQEYFTEVEDKYIKMQERILKGISDVSELMSMNKTQKEMAAFIGEYYTDISGILFQFIKTDLIKMFAQLQWTKLSKDKKMSLLNIKYESEEKPTV